jgi:pimeloyl-ACP methyl ester carboxylesterase
MSLYVHEQGPAEAPSILFLHGGGGAGWMWKPQLEALAEFHILAPDLPEHGQSAHLKPFRIADSAVQMANLIQNRAHGGKAHVVGLSEGAQVALALLAQSPQLLHSAILSSALVRPMPGAHLLSPSLVALSVKWFVEPFRNLDGWIRLNMKFSAGVPEKYYSYFKNDFRNLTGELFSHVLVENQCFRLPEGLEAVNVPTLVIAGKKEYGIMRQSVAEIAAAIPGARGFLVAHSRNLSLAEEHNWNLTAPDLFTRMVRAWIDGGPLPAELQPLQGKEKMMQSEGRKNEYN